MKTPADCLGKVASRSEESGTLGSGLLDASVLPGGFPQPVIQHNARATESLWIVGIAAPSGAGGTISCCLSFGQPGEQADRPHPAFRSEGSYLFLYPSGESLEAADAARE